jgi:hypothetical protein
MKGWTSNAEVKMVEVLGRHSMNHPAIVLVVHAVHSMTATAGCHRRTRKHHRKCCGSNESEVCHNRSPLGSKHRSALCQGGNGAAAVTVQAAPLGKTRLLKQYDSANTQTAKQTGSPL